MVGVHKVRAAARVRSCAARIRDGRKLAFFGVDHNQLVASVGRRDEVAVGRVKTAIMQEAFGFDLCGFEVLEVGIIDQKNLAGFLDVDDNSGGSGSPDRGTRGSGW